MSLSEMFDRLGAPLSNVRWSWGSVRAADGVVFLRVWQDGTKKVGDKRYVWVSDASPVSDSPGAPERLRHVELVRSGATCYLIMCEAVDPKIEPRAVKDFNRNEVFETGDIIEIDRDFWVELRGRVNARSVAA